MNRSSRRCIWKCRVGLKLSNPKQGCREHLRYSTYSPWKYFGSSKLLPKWPPVVKIDLSHSFWRSLPRRNSWRIAFWRKFSENSQLLLPRRKNASRILLADRHRHNLWLASRTQTTKIWGILMYFFATVGLDCYSRERLTSDTLEYEDH
jgi:hypothetical protein